MEKLSLEYVAGLIDGEGSIMLLKSHKKDPFRRPVISLTNTCEKLIDLLQSQFGGYKRKQKTYKEHHKKAWIWRIEYNKVIDLLNQIHEYLIIPEKRWRSQLLITKYKACTPRNGKYTQEEFLNKQKFEELFFHPSIPLE